MEKIVPAISSSVRGPLGACHLPRLWLKIVLHAAGRLPDGYRHGEGGFDGKTLENLGLDAPSFINYLETQRPSYLACEEWVRAHATKLDPVSLAAHNQMILEFDKPDEMAQRSREDIGEGAPLTRNSITLNDLDDWALLHRAIVAAT